MRHLAYLLFIISAITNPSLAKPVLQTSVNKPTVLVEIYTIPGCGGCGRAKAMFDDRSIPYKEISLAGRRDLYDQMKKRAYEQMPPSERRPMEESMTVPRIFINNKYIGGYSDLDGSMLDKLNSSAKPITLESSEDTASQNNKKSES
jgi:glutaredoxin